MAEVGCPGEVPIDFVLTVTPTSSIDPPALNKARAGCDSLLLRRHPRVPQHRLSAISCAACSTFQLRQEADGRASGFAVQAPGTRVDSSAGSPERARVARFHEQRG